MTIAFEESGVKAHNSSTPRGSPHFTGPLGQTGDDCSRSRETHSTGVLETRPRTKNCLPHLEPIYWDYQRRREDEETTLEPRRTLTTQRDVDLGGRHHPRARFVN